MENRFFIRTVSSADRKQTLKVIALDASSGKILWEQTAYEGQVYDARHRRSSFAGPTAATDGALVFGYFGPEGLYAYDMSGKLIWKAVEKFATLGLGTGTSPLLYQHLVIVQRDENNGDNSSIVAYDKETGKEAWRVKRPVQISWGTPVLVTSGSRTELVTNGTEFIIAYDPATGKELWRTKGVESNAIHTPLIGHGLVIVTAGYPAKKVIAIRPGDVPADKRIAWEYSKGTGYVLSNIIYGDYLYLFTDNGIVTCLDPKTGTVKYRGWPSAGADAVHGIAGRILRIRRDDERGGRHLHAEGWPHTRNRPDECRGRARLLLTGDLERTDLHSRREASVRDWEIRKAINFHLLGLLARHPARYEV